MLGTNLKNARKNRGLTQKELAKAVNIDRSNLSYYERGMYKPSVDTLIALADVLQCSLDILCDRKS